MAHAKLSPSQRFVQTFWRAWSFAGYGMQVLLPRLPRLVRARTQPLLDAKMDGLRLQIFPCIPAGAGIDQEFAELIAAIPEASAFQTLHWTRPLLEYPERLLRLRMIHVHDRGKLIGVLPLEQFWHGAFTVPGGMMSDYLDPVVHPGYRERFWHVVLMALRRYREECSLTLDLPNLSSDCPDRRVLFAVARAAGFEMIESPFDISAQIHLRNSWEEQLATLKARDRKELRRKLRRAVEQGNATHRVIDSPGEIDAAITHTLDLMRVGGGGKGRKARWVFADHFRACAAPLACEGRLRVHQLLLQDQVAATLIAFPQKTREILWCGAYDARFASLSPGISLFALVIQNAIAGRLRVLDLLSGQHEYKYHLGAVDHPLYRITLVR